MNSAGEIDDLDLPAAREGLGHPDLPAVVSDLLYQHLAAFPWREPLGHGPDLSRGKVHVLDEPLFDGRVDVRTLMDIFEPHQLAAGKLRPPDVDTGRCWFVRLVDDLHRTRRQIAEPEFALVVVVSSIEGDERTVVRQV